jgi:TetR/AcrR family transcriptional regulator, regulator of autoinduction and epiphytic fitness
VVDRGVDIRARLVVKYRYTMVLDSEDEKMAQPAAGQWLDIPDEEGTSRQARRRGRKVNDMMAFTAQMIAERGYHMTSLDDIADRLDLSKASIYHYFDGKEALVLATLESCAEYSYQQLSQAAKSEGTATERLRALIRRHLYISSVENVEIARLFMQPLDWPPTIAEAVNKRLRDHIRLFRDVIRTGIDAGEFGITDERIANMAIQGAMSLVPAWYGKELGGRNSASVLEDLTDELMRLVAPQADIALRGETGELSGLSK